MKVQNQLCISSVSRLKTAFPKLALCLLAAGSITASSADVIIFDDFSSNTVGTPTFAVDPSVAWVVDSGQFAANGTNVGNFNPVAGQLNMSATAGSRIHIDLAPVLDNTPVSVTFLLRQSDGTNGISYSIKFGFLNSTANQSYLEVATPNPNSIYDSGFAKYDDSGNVVQGALPGSSLNSDTSFQKITMEFDPLNGISVYKDDVLVSSWNNYFNLTTVDQFVLEQGAAGGVSWFMDDFTATATVPEPGVMTLLGLSLFAAGATFVVRRRKASVA